MSANDEKMLKLSPVSCQVPWKTLLTARKVKQNCTCLFRVDPKHIDNRAETQTEKLHQLL